MTSSSLLSMATFLYAGAALAYLLALFFRPRALGLAGTALTALGFLANTTGFFVRWYESYELGFGRIPLTNLYESLVFFAGTIALFYLVVERRFGLRLLGAFVTPVAALTMAFASFSPVARDEIEPLVPALQSNWLTIHVLTSFLGYAAFATAAGVSIAYLVRHYLAGEAAEGLWARFPAPGLLDELNYKVIAVGLPLLTVGIVTGAAWADYAWGSYWSWDPKETWSLIVWFVYAAFMHVRFTRGWQGKRAAWLSLVGFGATIFCYLGVNLVLSGLHSYGGSG